MQLKSGCSTQQDTYKKIQSLYPIEWFVLQTIQTYILPLLYGLLGAYAYVLIQISKEIKLLTYLEALNVNYRLRLQLGALSGLAVGWFINPDSSSTVIMSC